MENIDSPNATSHQYSSDKPFLMSTPKTNKINDSKSPHRIMQKKSKRRDCTPEYSPPDSETKGFIKGKFFTERKDHIKRTNLFDQQQNQHERNLFKEFSMVRDTDSLFQCSTQRQSLNLNPQPTQNPLRNTEPKKKFLSLIEECASEIPESYYGILGKQTTPDTLLTTVFSDMEDLSLLKSRKSTENPEIRMPNSLNNKLSNFIYENLTVFLKSISLNVSDSLGKMVYFKFIFLKTFFKNN